MILLPLRDNRVLEWEPTTDLLCTVCREPLDIFTLLQNTLDCVNFLFDAQPAFPGQLAQGDYFYLHKRCSRIYGALIREGADIAWAWYEMRYVLGLDPLLQRLLWQSPAVCTHDHAHWSV
jgi:hypothetical protein